MPTHMANEIDSYTSRPFILEIAVQTQWTEMAFEFSAEKWRGLAAAGVAGFLGAEEDKVFMGTGACCEN